MKQLSSEERLRLMRFVCSFAWADFEVQNEEKTYIHKLIRRLKLNKAETEKVEEWLELPPRAEELDPQDVPLAHRQLFLAEVRGIILADGVLHPNERDNLELFEALLKV